MNTEQQIDELVERIHLSDIYGCFVEMGCGVAVTNALMSVSGATRTIYMSESPYAREYQHKKYTNQNFRAVSKDCVATILYNQQWSLLEDSDRINSIYVASFQLGENGSCHGWIGFKYKEKTRFYHISIHEKLTRKQYLEKISLCALTIVDAKNEYVPANACIDIADGFGNNDIEMYDMIRQTQDDFLCVRDGQFHRMEDFFRDEENILIFKGSFNPIHNGHIEIAEAVEAEYGSKPKLMISTEIYGKGTITPLELKSRIEDLNKLGFDVLISRSGFFNTNIKHLRRKFNQPIIFAVGADTLVRIFQSTYPVLDNNCDLVKHYPYHKSLEAFKEEFDNVRLFVVKRDGYEIPTVLVSQQEVSERIEIRTIGHSSVSSTKIRENGLVDHIPEAIRDKYTK